MTNTIDSALAFWHEAPIVDPFDPNTWEEPGECRIYDPDMIRYARVDAKYYSQLVTIRENRYGHLVTRRWHVQPPHKRRNGDKKYFVSKAGWRQGQQTYLHVAVMKLTGRLPPSKRHKLVHHKDGDDWNCTEDNLEWATSVKNRRHSRQKYNRPMEP